MKFRFALTLVSTLIATPALSLEDADKAAIKTTFDALGVDIKNNDFGGMFTAMPPKLFDAIIQKAGIDKETLLKAVEEQMQQTMSKVKIEEFSYDMDGVESSKTENGLEYALIPTRTVMNVEGTRLESKSSTLALKDDSKWYIVRLDSPQHYEILGTVYPDLADLKLPESETKQLD